MHFYLSFKSLVLSRNSTALKYFIKPPLNPQLRVHIFNYTNTERFLQGIDKKLIVQDIGPYVYTEKVEKVNVTYNDNNTISYRVIFVYKNVEKKTMGFSVERHQSFHFFFVVLVGLTRSSVHLIFGQISLWVIKMMSLLCQMFRS